jgi:hypothetical protein
MNVKVKVYYVYTVYFIKSIYILSYIFYKKHAYNRHDVAMLHDTALWAAMQDGSGGCECSDGCCHKVSTRVESLPEHCAIFYFPENCKCVPSFSK